MKVVKKEGEKDGERDVMEVWDGREETSPSTSTYSALSWSV